MNNMRFESYNPLVNVIYFVVAFGMLIYINNPIFVALECLCFAVYATYLYKEKMLVHIFVSIIICVAYFAYYVSFHHFGMTVLGKNFIGNNVTIESIAYSLVLGVKIASVYLCFLCLLRIVNVEKVLYIIGLICPPLAMYMGILHRLWPLVISRGKQMELDVKGSKIYEKSMFASIKIKQKVISNTITWILEHLINMSIAMKSRGYGKSRRVTYHRFAMNGRDRALMIVLWILICIILILTGTSCFTTIFDPVIIFKCSPSIMLVGGILYGCFLIMPFMLSLTFDITYYRINR